MQLVKNFLKTGLVALTFGASIANANLIVNGSFEDNDVNHGAWKWFTSENVNGWEGSNIEIWDHLFNKPAYHGQQFAELNSHPEPSGGYTIFQEFDTIAGQKYDLSFAYQARVDSANEAFSASILDVTGLIQEWILDDHTTAGWSVMKSTFTAESTISRLEFTAITPVTHTYGNFLDDIRVTNHVSEPGTLALFSLGLLGLGLARRRMKVD